MKNNIRLYIFLDIIIRTSESYKREAISSRAPGVRDKCATTNSPATQTKYPIIAYIYVRQFGSWVILYYVFFFFFFCIRSSMYFIIIYLEGGAMYAYTTTYTLLLRRRWLKTNGSEYRFPIPYMHCVHLLYMYCICIFIYLLFRRRWRCLFIFCFR